MIPSSSASFGVSQVLRSVAMAISSHVLPVAFAKRFEIAFFFFTRVSAAMAMSVT